MRKFKLRIGALIGLILTAPMIAVMYLANQLVDLSFVPFDFFDWVARVLPGPIITFGIDAMIDTMLFLGIDVADSAKTAEHAIAIFAFLGVWVVGGMLFISIMKKIDVRPSPRTGILLGMIIGIPMIGISIAISQSPVNPFISFIWLTVLFLAWGILFCQIGVSHLDRLPARELKTDDEVTVERISRREFLVSVGAVSAAITVIGAGLGAVLAKSERREEESVSQDEVFETSPDHLFPNRDDPTVPAPGTRPEYTPVKDHYKVFIRSKPSEIPAEGYVLPITGLVDNPLSLTLDDIRNNYTSRDQYVTLSCISGRIATTLISTTLWTGVSLQDILADAVVRDRARYLLISSEDGFHEAVSINLIASDERIMLCYAWDGNNLPIGHGFPLRIWIPDRYGMKQPKWITSIEVSDKEEPGYWVKRDWDEVAWVKTTSVIDMVAVDSIIENGDQRLIPIGGIAFSGARGISKVEVRVDSGAWQEAQLRAPLSETTWVIWRYDWPFEAGQHTFEVRCREGDGTPQIEKYSDIRPNGATGIHRVEEDI